jgi:hypothetical protein
MRDSQVSLKQIPGVPDFDRLAWTYRWMEWLTFGPWLRRCRCFFLDELGQCRHALILGDGDGRFAARLLARNPAIRVDAIDASRAMLSQLMRRAGRHRHRVTTHLADLRAWTPESEYDLVVTHFFLDCLSTEDVGILARRVRSHVLPNAVWVVSEFNEPAGWLGRVAARPLISVLYWCFGLLTGLKVRRLPDHHKALTNAGFALTRRHPSLGGLLMSEVWEAHATFPSTHSVS